VKVVYIAGPYTNGNQAANVRSALVAVHNVIDAGGAPICPLLFHFAELVQFTRSWETWMKVDLKLLTRSDIVWRLPGSSKGADIEVDVAKKMGLPVVRSYADLQKSLTD